MSEPIVARIEELLASSEQPLTTPEIAERLNVAPELVDHELWGRPDTFAWQPGHRWARNTPKGPATRAAAAEHSDARAQPLTPREALELRAVTLTTGITLRVTKRPIDSASLFTVESRGGELRLALNSSHPAFVEYPMPFSSPGDEPHDYRELLELLLEAWALHEDGVPSGEPKGRLEETRLMWGRRVAQLLAESR